jgi:hypothetical protein
MCITMITPRLCRRPLARSLAPGALTLPLVAGCPAGRDNPPSPVASSSVTPSASGKDNEVRAGDRSVWQGECAAIVLQMQQVLKALPSKCRTNQDCVCYAGGIESVTGCGGVSDRSTADQIFALQQRFNNKRCSYRVDCGPGLCKASCVDGTCK